MLFSVAAHESTDQNLALSTLLGQTGRDLDEAIFLASSNTERIRLVTTFLQNRLRHITEDELDLLLFVQTISST